MELHDGNIYVKVNMEKEVSLQLNFHNEMCLMKLCSIVVTLEVKIKLYKSYYQIFNCNSFDKLITLYCYL